jgi:hypothetical protein
MVFSKDLYILITSLYIEILNLVLAAQCGKNRTRCIIWGVEL